MFVTNMGVPVPAMHLHSSIRNTIWMEALFLFIPSMITFTICLVEIIKFDTSSLISSFSVYDILLPSLQSISTVLNFLDTFPANNTFYFIFGLFNSVDH